MPRCDVHLHGRITDLDRVAIFDDQIALERRECSLFSARAGVTALLVHFPVTQSHADARARQLLHGRGAAHVIRVPVRDDDVLHVFGIEAELLHGLRDHIRGVFVRCIDKDQSLACLQHVRADVLQPDVIQIVEELERRRRAQIFLSESEVGKNHEDTKTQRSAKFHSNISGK